MKHWLFAGKRCLHSISLLIMIGMIIVLLPFTAGLGRMSEQLPAGVVDMDGSVLSQRIVAELLKNGFVCYTDEHTLTDAVGTGRADCGVVLPCGLSSLMEQGTLGKNIRVICSAQSMAKDMYLGHVSAALFSELAPYITAKELEPFEIPTEAVLEEYHAMLAGGYTFSFELLTEAGLPAPENVHAESLMLGVTAVLLYIAVSMNVAELVHKDGNSVAGRIGRKQAVYRVVLPGIALRLCLLWIATAAGLFLSGPITDGFEEVTLLVPALMYSLLITGFSLIAAWVCPDGRVLYLLLFVVLIAAVVICPVYIDIAIVSPLLAKLRNLIPVYWLWKISLIF